MPSNVVFTPVRPFRLGTSYMAKRFINTDSNKVWPHTGSGLEGDSSLVCMSHPTDFPTRFQGIISPICVLFFVPSHTTRPYHKTIPRIPQVQLIGNGTVYNHVGIGTAVLKHPSHTAFHKNPILSADEAAGMTPFYRWHMDAALYDHSPSKVTTLYGIQVPQPERPPLHVLFMAHDDQKFSEVE
jgi:Taurine catabolism dioxygenase TauD, TfdA family